MSCSWSDGQLYNSIQKYAKRHAVGLGAEEDLHVSQSWYFSKQGLRELDTKLMWPVTIHQVVSYEPIVWKWRINLAAYLM